MVMDGGPDCWVCMINIQVYTYVYIYTAYQSSFHRAIVRSKFDYGCIVYGTASNTNLRQLESIHNSGLRLALGAVCTSPVSSLYTEANKAPLEERRLKLSMHYYVKTRAWIDNPAHHALHELDRTTRDLYAPRPNGRGGMTQSPVPPIGLKVEEAMTSAEINAELVCPLRTPNFPPGTHDYDPKRHGLIEGVSKCMISGQEAQAKFNEYHEAQGSHDEIYTDGSKMNETVGAAFPEWWDNLPPAVQKTARQQDNLCSWGYSHQSGTELLPTHGSSPSWCSCLLWLNVLFAGNWGWRYREPFYLPYHEPALVIDWQRHTCSFLLGTKPLWHWRKWKSGPTSKRDPRPRYRLTGKCPLYRYETTGQLLHSEVGSSQVGCSCTRQRSISCETNTGATEEVPAPNQSWRGCNHRLRIGHTKTTKSHVSSRGPPTGCHHCGQTLTIDHMLLECALLQECRDEYYTVDSLNALFETIPETCIVEFLQEAGFFYLIWCNLLTSTSPQTWTIWSDLSNCLENESNSETHLLVKDFFLCFFFQFFIIVVNAMYLNMGSFVYFSMYFGSLE